MGWSLFCPMARRVDLREKPSRSCGLSNIAKPYYWSRRELRRSSLMMPASALREMLRTLPSAAGATFLALFPIVNPFGGVPLFFAMTADDPAPERNRTALKTSTYVFAILVAFMMKVVDVRKELVK